MSRSCRQCGSRLVYIIGVGFIFCASFLACMDGKNRAETEFVRQLCEKMPGFLSSVDSSNYPDDPALNEPALNGRAAIWITGDGADIFQVSGKDNSYEEMVLKGQYKTHGWFMDPRKPATSRDHLTPSGDLVYPGNHLYQDASSLIIVKLLATIDEIYFVPPSNAPIYKKSVFGRMIRRDEGPIWGSRSEYSRESFRMRFYLMAVWVIDLETGEITGRKLFPHFPPPDEMPKQANGQLERDALMDWIRDIN